jgi:hypothetical protein
MPVVAPDCQLGDYDAVMTPSRLSCLLIRALAAMPASAGRLSLKASGGAAWDQFRA